MNVVVCVKQVPETTDVKINPETNTLMREGVASIINPFDMYAIEEGLKLRDLLGGKVTALSMGPPQAEAALREAISMGVDEGILVCGREFAGSDTWATSYALAMAIRKINFGLVSLHLTCAMGLIKSILETLSEFFRHKFGDRFSEHLCLFGIWMIMGDNKDCTFAT